jgi:16S rRNA (uracil1498-N3)-methyltransferase
VTPAEPPREPRSALPAWIFLPDLRSHGGEIVLAGDDAHWVARVCRANPGDVVTATDGAGAVATLELLAVRGEVRGRLTSRRDVARGARAIVACGAPEKDRADWLVEKLAELGVAELQPLECARGAWERFAARRDRFERLAAAALRQSRRAWKLAIAEPARPADWLAGLTGEGRRWLADAEGAPAGPGAGETFLDRVAIGPASGFDAPERAALRESGFMPVRLASARLRTETAAVAWASLWAAGQAASGGS